MYANSIAENVSASEIMNSHIPDFFELVRYGEGAEKVPDEAAKMETWYRNELEQVKLTGARHIIEFQQYFNIPKPVRERYLRLLHEYGVQQVFAGHLHHDELGRDGELEMVTTGPVGMPLEGGKSGLRVITVKDGTVTHKFYEFGDLP